MQLEQYLIVSVLIVAASGITPLLIPGGTRAFPRLVASGTLMTLAGVLVLVLRGGDHFGLIHVAYAVISWSLPIVGSALVVFAIVRLRERKIALGSVTLVALALLGAGGLGYYGTNVEPRQLEVNTTGIDFANNKQDTLKLVVLADIQSVAVGRHERQAVEAATAQEGDIILYAGDLYSAENNPFPHNRADFVDLVSDLQAESGTVMVMGDHDGDGALPGIAKDGGATLLVNQSQVVDVRGMRIGVLGVDNFHTSDRTQAALRAFSAKRDLDYRILLSHKPDVIFNTPEGIDLVVSGHTHGGQVQVPLVGPLMTLSKVPRDHAAGGLFDYPSKKLFVTRGVGVERGEAPVIRFGAPPEINVLNVNL